MIKRNSQVLKFVVERKSMPHLMGKVVIVSGGGSGMGRAASMLFASEGANVAILDWNEKIGMESSKLIENKGGNCIFIKTDVSKVKEIESAVSRTLDWYGKVNALFSNAGVNHYRSSIETAEDDWQRLVDINLKGAFFLARDVAERMIEASVGGSILFTSSISAIDGEADQVAYSATKGGIKALVPAMAKEFGPYGIRVNCLLPGPVDTPLYREWLSLQPNPAKANADVVNCLILKRLGSPEEIAKAALFFLSDDSSWITGTSLPIDGGYLVRP